jgi:hypothetical protein
MGNDRSFPTRKYRSKHPPVRSNLRMTDAIRCAKKGEQPAGCDCVVDCGVRHPHLKQLPARNYPVLLFGQCGNLLPPPATPVPLPHHLALRHSAGNISPPNELPVFVCLTWAGKGTAEPA